MDPAASSFAGNDRASFAMAVRTSVNAPPNFASRYLATLAGSSGLSLVSARNPSGVRTTGTARPTLPEGLPPRSSL
jgi:hypothetical protein